MNHFFSLMMLLTAFPALMMSQSSQQFQVPIDPELIQQPAKFTVSNQIQDTSTRIAGIRNFKMRAGESKAVVVTDSSIISQDISTLPIREEVFDKQEVFIMPELYFAREEGTGRQISYRIVFLDSAPLRYDFNDKLFKGSIRFLPMEEGYDFTNQPAQKTLSVSDSIFISFGSTSIPLSIRQINWPPLDKVIIESEPRDSLMIKILTISNPFGYTFVLPVEPAIILSANRSIIQGLGIQTLPVHVALKGITRYRPIPLTVETSLGTLESASLTLSDDQPGEVILRSESVGLIKLNIANHNYRSNSISVRAVFPWLFWLLAILGGAIGGLAKRLKDKEKITPGAISLGGILGLIAAVAYWGLGIKVIDISFTTQGINEIMVLGIGLLAGYLGLSIGATKKG